MSADPSENAKTAPDAEPCGSVRVKLSCCGKIVSPASLKQWLMDLLDQGKWSFACPHCASPWLWPLVRKFTLLSEEDRLLCESKIQAMNQDNFQKCPRCTQLCQRQTDDTNLCVTCTPCSEELRKMYRFCWGCQRKWAGPWPREDICANKGCAVQTSLLSCPLIDSPDTDVHGCPILRACPCCNTMVFHMQDGCSNVVCPQDDCGTTFCFRCLAKDYKHVYPEYIRDEPGDVLNRDSDEDSFDEFYDDEDEEELCVIQGRQRPFGTGKRKRERDNEEDRQESKKVQINTGGN
ncbi:uncharacterized protein LOC120525154 [Polypterus senegalus]|uniref:uncharacterized protein LOC120525154 n=1 Tax=Polypterus senegalus TaxID=55291 RepID=UPI001962898F|nr:uncharacterized protein LOC120525154 [Polypterus senegalus]